VVAKRATSTYRPGFRGWVKVKNRDYWRAGEERELMARRRTTRSSRQASGVEKVENLLRVL